MLGWAGLEVFDVSICKKQGMQALFGRKQTTDRGLRGAIAPGSERREQCGEKFDR